MKDLKNNLVVVQSIAPAAAKTASVNGTGVDLQGFESALVSFEVGVITDGTHTPKVQESDDNSTYTDVAAKDLIGTLAALASSTPQSVSYIGSKRYIRPVSTVAGATSGGFYVANVIKSNARH